MSRRWLALPCLIYHLAGCGHAAPHSSLVIPDLEATRGARIYRGTVEPVGRRSATARFTYERYVDGSRWVHLTRDNSGHPVVLHAATVDAHGNLERFEAIQAQTGTTAEISVIGESASFRVDSPRRIHTRRETSDVPLLVGPTLFPFILRNWDAIVGRDARYDVRFAVAERGRSYPFELFLESTNPETTIVVMRARPLWLRAALAPIRMTWATSSRTILRYEGRVPPRQRRGRRWQALDARVEYAHDVP